ncbi:nuclear transport factor 2 family protein [Brevibacterium senegalense]|uniref:nuclear transport factor 2 family protein n=1 Tax=Brevibacterium senegalense TaxID=1033736 RepID=UPI0002FAFF9D|nr:nuclear transport factor 2 family protein [Brevibacterium senegalense]
MSSAHADLLARVQRLEDIHEISQLRARYCQALDDGRWEDLADTFTDDGAFIGLSTARGREEMLEFFPTLNASTVTSWWHFSSNETVDIDGDEASGVTWLLQPCVVDGQSQIAAGRYEDVMVRTASGWRFRTRKVSFFFWSSLESGWDAARFDFPPAVGAEDARTRQRLSQQRQ